MRNTITKTVSMMLVTVMVLGVVAMPFRAHADVVDDLLNMYVTDLAWREVMRLTKNIGKEMLNPVNNSPNTSAISKFSAFFEHGDTGKHMFVTAKQMNELASSLLNMGINVQPATIPGGYWALVLLDNKVGGEAGTIVLDADPGDVYVYEGYTVVRLIAGGNDPSDTDSDSAIESNRPSYAPVDPIEPESPPAGGDDNLVVGPSGSIINQNTTTINQNTINNTEVEIKLVDGRTYYYNKQTDTYYIKNYNGDYVECLNLSYNPITQTYNATTNEYNSTTNNYDQRQYTYQFYYDYTYITYIGSSAEYREAYKVYFELPDGRSSGDLTVDELKGISLQFDMVNYDKAASDNLTQILLPFDGSLDNTSYYPASSSWLSTSGYSFLESPEPFGGSLYSSVTNSSGSNTFVSSLDSRFSPNSSFTVQGRFYLDGLWEGDSLSPSDSVSFGATFWDSRNSFEVYIPFFRISYFTGDANPRLQMQVYTSGSSSSFVALYPAVGVWHDFCLVFDSDSSFFHFYLDGIATSTRPVSQLSTMYMIPLGSLKTGNLREFGNGVYWREDFGWNILWNNLSLSGVCFQNGLETAPLRVDNLRLVSYPLYTGSSVPIPQAPFDTNLAYVLPSVADLNDNTVAIMSQLPVSGYRVGGIRPTDPTLAAGYIYMHIDGDFVDSVQQWNGAYWEEVTARLYTGIRWIPVTAFNVFTLEDMFDIISPNGDGSGDALDSIFQYYLWWSGEWGTFQDWLKGTMATLIEAIKASGGGGGSSDAPVIIVPGVNDQTTTNEITTENPDGSITKTIIVSNAAGLVYSNSVTTYPTDANGNTKTITVYTDSSGVMYQTETIIDKDGNVTVTEPTQATGTLGAILKMITNGVMSIAGTVIEGFVTIVVDGVKFIIEFADDLLSGIGNLLGSLLSALIDFGQTGNDNALLVPQEGTTPILTAIYDALPAELTATLNLAFIMALLFGVFRFIHF